MSLLSSARTPSITQKRWFSQSRSLMLMRESTAPALRSRVPKTSPAMRAWIRAPRHIRHGSSVTTRTQSVRRWFPTLVAASRAPRPAAFRLGPEPPRPRALLRGPGRPGLRPEPVAWGPAKGSCRRDSWTALLDFGPGNPCSVSAWDVSGILKEQGGSSTRWLHGCQECARLRPRCIFVLCRITIIPWLEIAGCLRGSIRKGDTHRNRNRYRNRKVARNRFRSRFRFRSRIAAVREQNCPEVATHCLRARKKATPLVSSVTPSWAWSPRVQDGWLVGSLEASGWGISPRMRPVGSVRPAMPPGEPLGL